MIHGSYNIKFQRMFGIFSWFLKVYVFIPRFLVEPRAMFYTTLVGKTLAQRLSLILRKKGKRFQDSMFTGSGSNLGFPDK